MTRSWTKAKMADCRWLKPALVGQFEFLEWTGDHHLRHTRFISLREDKNARDVRRNRGHRHRPEIESRSPSASQRIHLLRTAFPVLPSLIDERPGNELNGVEFADGEAVEPSLAFAAETPEPSAGSVPLCDVDAVRAALAEEDDGHGELVYASGERKTKLSEDPEFCGGSSVCPQHFILRVREKLHQRFSDAR